MSRTYTPLVNFIVLYEVFGNKNAMYNKKYNLPAKIEALFFFSFKGGTKCDHPTRPQLSTRTKSNNELIFQT